MNILSRLFRTRNTGPAVSAQKQNDCAMAPVLRTIKSTLMADEPDEAKDTAIDYLIRKPAITQPVFMVEYVKLGLDMHKNPDSTSIH